MLSYKVIDLTLFLINLTFKLLLSCLELILLSLISRGTSRFHFFKLHQVSLLQIDSLIKLLSKTLVFLLFVSVFQFMFKFKLIKFLFHFLQVTSQSSSSVIMLLLRLLSFFNEFVFHVIYSLLEFFTANYRLTVLCLQTLKKRIISDSIFFKFFLFFIKLELRKFESLLEDSLFLCPILFSHVKGLLCILELRL